MQEFSKSLIEVTKSWKRKSINEERAQKEKGQAETLLAAFE